MMKILLVTLSLFTFTACTHSVHLYHVSEYEGASKSGRVIKAEGVQYVVLNFVFETDYVDQAYASLREQCSGRITNINTRYSTSHSFLSWYNKVKITALCNN